MPPIPLPTPQVTTITEIHVTGVRVDHVSSDDKDSSVTIFYAGVGDGLGPRGRPRAGAAQCSLADAASTDLRDRASVEALLAKLLRLA